MIDDYQLCFSNSWNVGLDKRLKSTDGQLDILKLLEATYTFA